MSNVFIYKVSENGVIAAAREIVALGSPIAEGMVDSPSKYLDGLEECCRNYKSPYTRKSPDQLKVEGFNELPLLELMSYAEHSGRPFSVTSH